MNIFVGAPVAWDINPYTYGSFGYNLVLLYKHLGVEITEPRFYDERPLSVARERMGEDFLDSGCDALLTHDTDQVFSPGTFATLVASAMETGADIMCGWSLARKKGVPVLLLFKREPGPLCDPDNFSYYRPYTYRELNRIPRLQIKNGQVIAVDGVGFGLVFITRKVLEKMKRPWFLEWSPVMKTQNDDFGEDLWFCDRAIEAGIEVNVNLNCFLGHWVRQGYTIGSQELYRRAMMEGVKDLDLPISA